MKLSEIITISFKEEAKRIEAEMARKAEQQLILYTDGHLVDRHLSSCSMFCRAVVNTGYLSESQMQRAALRYRLGMSRDGGVIFWQIGRSGHIYDGKIMYYLNNCHRDHSHNPTWVYAELKKFYLADMPDLMAELSFPHSLFGMHLLDTDSCPIAIVESEKTAFIMSELFPDYTWMATGGLSELSASKLFALKGRKIVIFPDTDETGNTYTKWHGLVKQSEQLLGQKIYLSPLLEQHASKDQKRRKIDLVEYYFESKDFSREK